MSDTCTQPLSPDEARHVDQTCDRFEAAWKAGRRADPADFVGPVAGPVRSALLRQLLLLDWDYRCRTGDDAHADDYYPRFPGERAVIDEVCRELSESPASTRLEPVSPSVIDTPRYGDRGQAFRPTRAGRKPA